MNLLAFFFACLVRGHHWRFSRSRRGYVVCASCGLRRRMA